MDEQLLTVLRPEITQELIDNPGEVHGLDDIEDLCLLNNLTLNQYGINCIVRIFDIKNNRFGSTLIVTDHEGTGRPLVLWDEQQQLIEGLKTGDVLFIKNANTRMAKDGVTLNAGDQSEIHRITDMIKPDAFAQGEVINTDIRREIANINVDDTMVSIAGTISKINHVREVDFGDKKNTMASIVVDDRTESVEVEFWGLHSSRVDILQDGDKIKLNNLKVKFKDRVILSFIKYSEMVHEPSIVVTDISNDNIRDDNELNSARNLKRINKNGIISSIPFNIANRRVFTIKDQRGNSYPVISPENTDIRLNDELQLIDVYIELVDEEYRFNIIIDDKSKINKIEI
jgi:hypothetical protein